MRSKWQPSERASAGDMPQKLRGLDVGKRPVEVCGRRERSGRCKGTRNVVAVEVFLGCMIFFFFFQLSPDHFIIPMVNPSYSLKQGRDGAENRISAVAMKLMSMQRLIVYGFLCGSMRVNFFLD